MPDRSTRLEDYTRRRDFRKTREPSADSSRSKLANGKDPIFVVQQHDATTMHWDFRIEVDGVLKSWAVPKGPSTEPRDTRLAVATEDHPLAYADFEGVIPEGEYGAGAVIVWDGGPYRNRSVDDDGVPITIEEALDRGRAEIELEGHKLRGAYVLIHSKMGGDEKSWLLIKKKDESADARRNPVRTEPKSILTGWTVDEIAEESR